MARSLFTLVLVALAGAAARAEEPPRAVPYYVGINGGYIRNVGEPARTAWAFQTGATMPRVGMRMDLARTMPGHPDAAVKKFCAAGRTALAFLMPGGGTLKLAEGETLAIVQKDGKTIPLPESAKVQIDEKVPDGLWKPVFASGRDEPQADDKLNPENEWASFVGQMVERYDGDGRDDAPGSPRLTWYSLYNEPDWMKWPDHPTDPKMKTLRNWLGHDFADLARLVFVSWRAAKFADPSARIGIQLCYASSLGLLLDDAKHPLAKNVDFIDFHGYAWPGSDTLLDAAGAGEGVLTVLAKMRAEFANRHIKEPLYLCSEAGYGSDEGGEAGPAVQRAAAAKVQVVGATIPDLITVQWYGLFDPSWKSMGLVADASKLPTDGKGAVFKDSFRAMQTAATFLAPMAAGKMRFVGPVQGEGARAFRFEREGQPLLAAWAVDSKGEPARTAQVALDLPAGKYARYHWDFALTGKPAELLESTGRPVTVTVGIDPVYFLRYEGEPKP